jgi:gluconokinase
MPASLLTSQFETLEPLAPDERGVVVDVAGSVDEIVEGYLAGSRLEED